MASESILASLRSSPSSTSRTCTTVPNGFKLPTLHSSTTHDVFQSIVKGRKSWKTLRGGEIVWPPELEAALLEGLEAYQPDDSRETRLLGRFPMRNRFISDFIYRKTGVRRTAKQVGSRLQQLRDTCGGKKLMKLLSPCRPLGPARYNDFYRSSSHYDTDSSSEASSSPPTPTDASTNFRRVGSSSPTSTTVISIDLLPPNTSTSYNPSLESMDWGSLNGVVHPSSRPRPFHMIDPTITFVAPSSLSAHSCFTVYTGGMVIHSETTSLAAVGSPPDRTNGAFLYSTTLVPNFWGRIAASSDPTQYTITQNVFQDAPDSQSIIFSALYKFTYSSGTQDIFSPPLERIENDKMMHDVHASLPLDCLLAMDTYSDLMDRESYYDLASIQNQQPSWASRSPSQLSCDISAYQHSDDGVDSVLSPVSTCFSSDASQYAS